MQNFPKKQCIVSYKSNPPQSSFMTQNKCEAVYLSTEILPSVGIFWFSYYFAVFGTFLCQPLGSGCVAHSQHV